MYTLAKLRDVTLPPFPPGHLCNTARHNMLRVSSAKFELQHERRLQSIGQLPAYAPRRVCLQTTTEQGDPQGTCVALAY